MKKPSQFRELFVIFRRHLLESDALAVDADYSSKLWQIWGLMAAPGLYSLLLTDFLFEPKALWILRQFRTLFAAFSFTVAAAATLFEWDMLFPDRRDFLILTQFPIRMRDLFAAKVASLGALIGTLVVALNAGTIGMFTLAFLLGQRTRSIHFLKAALLFIGSNAGAALFGFLCVATLQSLLVNFTTIRLFRRISPYIQSLGMSLMVLSLVLCPIYSNVQLVRAFRPEWLWWWPPYWFIAMQEPATSQTDYIFPAIAALGLRALAIVFVVCAVTWTIGFARHYRRTLEADDAVAGKIKGRSWADSLLRSPAEKGIFRFSGATLRRSVKHRMFLACYCSLGIGMGIVMSLEMDMHGISWSVEGERAFPFLMIFFVISGMRTVFQFPAELNANWLFQLTEAHWGPAVRRVTRLRTIATGLFPALLIFAPFEIYSWGTAGLMHLALEAVSGLLLAEILFWSFDKVPFTCSWFPGRINVALLVGLYLYGFTAYSFRMVDLEKWIESHPALGIAPIALGFIVVALIWKWRSSEMEVIRFDGTEPEIQCLNLS